MEMRNISGLSQTQGLSASTPAGVSGDTKKSKEQKSPEAVRDSISITKSYTPESVKEAAPKAIALEPSAAEQTVSLPEVKVQPEVLHHEGKVVYTNPNGTLTSLQQANTAKSGGRTAPVFEYIRDSWKTLSRSATSAASLSDSKAGAPILYVPQQDMERVGKENPELNIRALKPGAGFDDVENHGLLYLPHEYVVPGGRFNEMYGWDSFFTIMGLVRSGENKLAEGMVKNMFYQVDNYGGKVLNANRSYYLDRSSPPFLSSSVLAVYEKTGDKEFLKDGIDHVIKEYNYWTNPHNGTEMDHLTPTGLSRYYSPVGKPCPEVEEGYYEDHDLPAHDPEFCKHDRAERESGWDMTDRFGYKCADHNPIDLNSYIYKFEKDLAVMYRELEGPDSPNAKIWDDKAQERKDLINKYCWNEEKGMYMDYNFKEGKQTQYESLATFVPLWAGLADEKQAARVMENLDKFEMDHGLVTTSEESGSKAVGKQWDYPAGWAPLHIMAAKGMRNYGFNEESDRVSVKFLNTITSNFDSAGGILEKYDVVKGCGNVDVGYGNQVGFGWTNAAFLELHHDMSKEAKEQLEKAG